MTVLYVTLWCNHYYIIFYVMLSNIWLWFMVEIFVCWCSINMLLTSCHHVCLTSITGAFPGYFDQHMRQNLFTAWCNHMQQAHIQFKSDIARIEVRRHSAWHLDACTCIFLAVLYNIDNKSTVTLGRRAFCSSGPASWNSLPVHLRLPDLTFGAFRQQLKTVLFVWVRSLCRITVLVQSPRTTL